MELIFVLISKQSYLYYIWTSKYSMPEQKQNSDHNRSQLFSF